MGELTLVARLVLAAVFAAAGLGKLADRSGAQRALGEFGAGEGPQAPRPLVPDTALTRRDPPKMRL